MKDWKIISQVYTVLQIPILNTKSTHRSKVIGCKKIYSENVQEEAGVTTWLSEKLDDKILIVLIHIKQKRHKMVQKNRKKKLCKN